MGGGWNFFRTFAPLFGVVRTLYGCKVSGNDALSCEFSGENSDNDGTVKGAGNTKKAQVVKLPLRFFMLKPCWAYM
jgi:hypothetical protein